MRKPRKSPNILLMRRVKTAHDMTVPGWGFIDAGTYLKVHHSNSRFVYVELRTDVLLRLARKSDCVRVA